MLHLVAWTNPAFVVDTVGCGPGQVPEDRLERVELLVHHVGITPPGALDTLRVPAVGREGLRDSTMIDDRGTQTVVYSQVVDQAGNRSCYSDPVTLAPIVSVPPDGVVSVELFDLQGRRVDGEPERRGVYYRRTTMADGRVVRKVVVIR
jgi:hypothetical protein